MLVCDRKKRYLPQIPQHSITSHFHLLSCLIMIRAKGTRPQKNSSFPSSLAGGRAVGHAHLLQRPLGPWKTLRPSDGSKGNAGAALPHPFTSCPGSRYGQRTWLDFFPKEGTQMTNRHVKRCSTLLIIREISQIKTTVRCYPTTVRMVMVKNTTNKKCWQRCGRRGILYTLGWNVNWCSYYIKVSQKIKNRNTIWPGISIPGNLSKRKH